MDEGTVHQPTAVTGNQGTVKADSSEQEQVLVQSSIYADTIGDVEDNLDDETPEKNNSKSKYFEHGKVIIESV